MRRFAARCSWAACLTLLALAVIMALVGTNTSEHPYTDEVARSGVSSELVTADPALASMVEFVEMNGLQEEILNGTKVLRAALALQPTPTEAASALHAMNAALRQGDELIWYRCTAPELHEGHSQQMKGKRGHESILQESGKPLRL